MAQLGERPLLELAHALGADPVAAADLPERRGASGLEPETRGHDRALALGEPAQQRTQLLPGDRVEDALVVVGREGVVEQVAEQPDLTVGVRERLGQRANLRVGAEQRLGLLELDSRPRCDLGQRRPALLAA